MQQINERRAWRLPERPEEVPYCMHQGIRVVASFLNKTFASPAVLLTWEGVWEYLKALKGWVVVWIGTIILGPVAIWTDMFGLELADVARGWLLFAAFVGAVVTPVVAFVSKHRQILKLTEIVENDLDELLGIRDDMLVQHRMLTAAAEVADVVGIRSNVGRSIRDAMKLGVLSGRQHRDLRTRIRNAIDGNYAWSREWANNLGENERAFVAMSFVEAAKGTVPIDSSVPQPFQKLECGLRAFIAYLDEAIAKKKAMLSTWNP